MRRAEALGLAEADAVDDRGVVELVRVEPVRLVEDRREEPLVGVPAGHVEDRVVASEEGRDLGLELLVELLRAADEAHRAEARAPAVHGLLLGLADPRVVGEAEVVVRGQHDDLAAADPDARALRATAGRALPCRSRPGAAPPSGRARCSTRLTRWPFRNDLSGDAVARERGVEDLERAVERGRARRHDLGAQGRRSDELHRAGRAAHDDRSRRLLHDEEDVVERPRARARRSDAPSRPRRAAGRRRRGRRRGSGSARTRVRSQFFQTRSRGTSWKR